MGMAYLIVYQVYVFSKLPKSFRAGKVISLQVFPTDWQFLFFVQNDSMCLLIFFTFMRNLIPREARVINLSGRAGPSGAKPREFERKIYLYVYIFEGVRTMTSDCLALSGAKFAYTEKHMRA